jgi:hypothetical protein
MRGRVAVFGTLGALATLVAGAFVVAPGVFVSVPAVRGAVERLSRLDPTLVMLGATLFVSLYVALAARSPTSERSFDATSEANRRYDRASTEPPEAVTADRRAVTATNLDSDIDEAIQRGGRRLQSVRRLLADLVAETYAGRHQTTVAEARETVATGAWTDDGVAAAFLGGENGPNPSLLSRIRLWLTPERERARRVDRTLRALDALAEAEP